MRARSLIARLVAAILCFTTLTGVTVHSNTVTMALQ